MCTPLELGNQGPSIFFKENCSLPFGLGIPTQIGQIWGQKDRKRHVKVTKSVVVVNG